MKHLKNTTSIIAVAAVAGFVGFASSSANAVDAIGSASAILVAPLTITADTALQFGTMLTGASVVTIAPGGGRSADIPAQLAGGTFAPASFTVNGATGTPYTISAIPATSVTDGTTVLVVDNFQHDAGATPTLVGGTDSFNVGADLHITGVAAAGTYNGTFTVTVNY